MAKALIGYMNSDLRDPRLAAENSRLRARVNELEALVVRLSEENDKLVAARAEELLVETAPRMQEMQPAWQAPLSCLELPATAGKPGETGEAPALACPVTRLLDTIA